VDELERRKRIGAEESAFTTNPYVLVGLGLAFLVAAVVFAVGAGTIFYGWWFLFPAVVMLGLGAQEIQKRRRVITGDSPADKERELLLAVRDNGSVTSTEAAMETSLTVKEADAMLSELANDGHLLISGEGGVLRYSLPNRRRVEEIG